MTTIIPLILIAISFIPGVICLGCQVFIIVGTLVQVLLVGMGVIEADNGKHYHSSDCNDGI
jgi:uncharacterized Tic20 family protein